MAEDKAELYTSPGGKFIRADTLPRILAHWHSFRAEQKRKHLIKYDGELYAGKEVEKLQRLPLKDELIDQVSNLSERSSITQKDIRKETTFPNVPCPRCQKMMALEGLYYAMDEVASVSYKCHSCAYEETRPGKLPDLPE
jgi:hypothetical protein